MLTTILYVQLVNRETSFQHNEHTFRLSPQNVNYPDLHHWKKIKEKYFMP